MNPHLRRFRTAQLNAAQNAAQQARTLRWLKREKAEIDALIAKARKCTCERDPLVEALTITTPTFCETCKGIRVPEGW